MNQPRLPGWARELPECCDAARPQRAARVCATQLPRCSEQNRVALDSTRRHTLLHRQVGQRRPSFCSYLVLEEPLLCELEGEPHGLHKKRLVVIGIVTRLWTIDVIKCHLGEMI